MIFLIAGLLTGCTGTGNPIEDEGSFSDLYINEFLAANDTTIFNEENDYVDWIELYNAGESDIVLSGIYITDDLDEPLMYALPDLSVPAGGYLLLWADNELYLGDYHLPFSLEKNGEQLGLSYIDDGGEPTLLDGVAFGEQEADVSLGRVPDGSDNWVELAIPTPGEEN